MATEKSSPTVAPAAKSLLVALCWLTTACLGAFLCFTHLGMMLSLLLGRFGIRAVAPVALLLALLLTHRLAHGMGLTGRARFLPLGLALALLAGSLGVSAWYIDLSWDGQWYHQTAVYALAKDWNPLSDPMRNFPQHLELWVHHYAKGPWYIAAALYDSTRQIELGKCTALLAFASMGLATFAAGLDWGLTRWQAAALALVVAFNPVALSELTTYLVDGIMISFLVVAVAAVVSAFHRPQPVLTWVGVLASIVSINAKFTGLVFLCFAFAAGWLWCAFLHRQWLLRYTAWTALSLLLGTFIFGYNPYVTNTIHRHQPFYPVLGSSEFPSLTQQGREGIELYETPKNLLGHNRFFRLSYATFGRPGNQPYRKEPNAQLMWPFTARPADLFYYRYHETRVAGFGPFFSGALLLALGLGIWLLFQPTRSRWAATLSAAAILSSLFISLHLWWPRYGPQLWLLPIVPIAFVFWASCSRWALRAAWTLIALLVINAAIAGVIRMTWETKATHKLRQQLTELSQPAGQLEIALGWFEIPVGERLKAWGVPFQPVRRVRNGTPLVSVVEGYPGEIQYRVLPAEVANPVIQ